MTVTLKVQVPPAVIAGVVDKATVLVADVVVKLFVPPQTENVPSATDRPAGNISVKLIPLREKLLGAPLGLDKLKVSVAVLP